MSLPGSIIAQTVTPIAEASMHAKMAHRKSEPLVVRSALATTGLTSKLEAATKLEATESRREETAKVFIFDSFVEVGKSTQKAKRERSKLRQFGSEKLAKNR